MNNAFHDYKELLEIEPPKNKMYYCRENEGVLGRFFFHVTVTG